LIPPGSEICDLIDSTLSAMGSVPSALRLPTELLETTDSSASVSIAFPMIVRTWCVFDVVSADVLVPSGNLYSSLTCARTGEVTSARSASAGRNARRVIEALLSGPAARRGRPREADPVGNRGRGQDPASRGPSFPRTIVRETHPRRSAAGEQPDARG